MRVRHHRLLGALALGGCLAGGARPAAALDGPKPGAVSASKLKLPDGPGSVKGLADAPTFDVFTAQVNYGVPFELPKGPAGFGPSLTLSYSGALGNSAVGVGWGLQPIQLRRSFRNGVPSYTDADELELIGIEGSGRLVPDPSHPGQYSLEGHGNRVRVLRKQSSFEVVDGSGMHYFLGQTAASRVESGQKVAAWYVEWILDVAGQEINFSYRHETGQIYLDTVTWGPAFAGGTSFKASFVYDSRPDAVLSYATGFGVQTGARLKRVEVRAFGDVLRSYDLVYADEVGDLSFSISRLHSVELHGHLGQGTMPKLTFGYAGIDLHDTEQLPGADGWVVNQRGVSFADVDGDGAADLLRLEMGNHEWRKSRGSEFAGERPIAGAGDVDLDASALIDLDGDARPELVRVVDDTWHAYKLVGESWHSLGEWPGTSGLPIHDDAAALADVNGDGRIDVIRGRTGGIAVNFNGATGMGPTLSLPRISATDVQVEPGADGVRFVDMNGDGVVDVAWMTDAWIKIFLGRGDGTFVPFDRVNYPWGTSALDPVAVQLADLNRDGLIDLVRIVDGQAQWYPGFASLHFAPVPRALRRPDGANSDAVVTITDANGNGSQDVVWSTPSGIWIQDLAGATSAGMLETIDNGLGEVVHIGYRSSAALAIDAELRGEPWQVKLPTAVPVPTRSETDPGGGFPLRVVEHSVRDGFWDGSERRFGGFLQGVTRTVGAQPADTLEVENRFHQGLGSERELRGKNWFAKRSSAGLIFDVVQQKFEAVLVDGLPDVPLARKAVLRSVSTFIYEGGTVPAETRTDNVFDGEGRVTEEHHLGVPTVAGDDKIVRRVYGLPDAVHVQDVVCQETVLEGDGQTVVADLRRFYGDTGQPLPFRSVGKGWVRSVQSWLRTPGAPDRWVEQSSATYDAAGNAISVGETSIFRDIEYDPFRLFPLRESLRGTSPAIAWVATWDQTLGEIATLTNPAGDVTKIGHDGLGRTTTISVNDAPAHVHYAYDWSAPLPTTTTWLFDGSMVELVSEGSTWPAGSHWRTTVGVSDGAGEPLFTATTLGGQYIIGDWKERDERGQVVRVAESFYAGSAFPTTPVVGTRIQTVEYDAIGRAKLQTAPNGATKSTVYRPLGRTVTSSELGPISYTLDGLQRVVHTERDPGSTAIETVDAHYDAADRITAVWLQGGQVVHAFAYDTLGRLIHASDPDVGNRSLVYDDRNLLIQHTNGEMQSVFFDYDVAGRLARRGETPLPSLDTDYSFTYDDPTGASGSDCRVVSRLASVREPAGDVHFCYDVLSRPIGTSRTIRPADAAPATGAKTQELSPSGLLLTETFDDGFSTRYHYDPAGRGDAVSSAEGLLWKADQVDAAGRVLLEHYGNGVTQAYEYGPLGLTSRIEVDRPSGLGTLYEVSIERNAFGAPAIVTDPNQGLGGRLDHSATFSYDGGGRLTLSTLGTGDRQFHFSFQYDALQNMIFRGVNGPPDVGDIGVLTGSYRYAERGYGPRQLTSVVPGSGP